MQGSERETALRQIGIERRNPEGEGTSFGRSPLQTRQQAAQVPHDIGMFSVLHVPILEQNKNIAITPVSLLLALGFPSN